MRAHDRKTLIDSLEKEGLDLIMLVEAGSRSYGTHTPDSDHDLIGVYLESDAEIYGLEQADSIRYRITNENPYLGEPTVEPLPENPTPKQLKHFTQQTSNYASVQKLPDGRYIQRLGKGIKRGRAFVDDIEVVLYPLRQFVTLVISGNANIVTTLWTPFGPKGTNYQEDETQLYSLITPTWETLVKTRGYLMSKHVGFRHAGYARSQRAALTGESNNRTNRPELVAKYGYDTKYAQHMIRLIYAGTDFIADGRFNLPMPAEQVRHLKAIRTGEYSLDRLLEIVDSGIERLEQLTQQSKLPDNVDKDYVNRLLRLLRKDHINAL